MAFSKKIASLIFACPIITNLIYCKHLTWESPSNYLFPTHKLTNLISIPQGKRPTGKGIKVGIIDTGIDFTHPALGGCFGKKCRVQYGKAFYTSDDFLPTHLKGAPYDNVGHGTGIAGIIGGNDENILGVAPDVIFGAYKISNSTVEVDKWDVIDSIEQALEDGMDIIVMSIGPEAKDTFWEWEFSKMNFRKTIVIVAAGNYGNYGDFGNVIRTYGIANRKEFITVASMTSSYSAVHDITINDSIITNFIYFYVFPDRPFQIFNENWILMPNDGTACEEFTNPSLQGKVVLVNDFDCSIETKVENLQKTNIAGVIIYGESLYFDFNYIPTVPVGGIKISKKRLQEILKDQTQIVAKRNPSRLSLQDGEGRVSHFSSWGPASSNYLKPDITSPGESITTTFPLNRGKYRSVVGTSYAAPYIAGLAALFLEINPNATPNDFSRALMNSAIPIKIKPDSDSVAVTVARQGAGAVNAYGLLMNKVVASPHTIPLGDFIKEKTITLKFTNNDDVPKVFTIGHLPSSMAIYDRYSNSDVLKLDFSPNLPRYPIAPGEFIEIRVTFLMKQEHLNDFLSGYIYLKEISTKETIHIPYFREV